MYYIIAHIGCVCCKKPDFIVGPFNNLENANIQAKLCAGTLASSISIIECEPVPDFVCGTQTFPIPFIDKIVRELTEEDGY